MALTSSSQRPGPLYILSRWIGCSPLQTLIMAVMLVLLVSITMIRPLATSLIAWNRTSAYIEEQRNDVRILERDNRMLRREVAFMTTNQFIYEQARRYGMSLPGEHTYVIRELAQHETQRTR